MVLGIQEKVDYNLKCEKIKFIRGDIAFMMVVVVVGPLK
jgi:hypothetical protein